MNKSWFPRTDYYRICIGKFCGSRSSSDVLAEKEIPTFLWACSFKCCKLCEKNTIAVEGGKIRWKGSYINNWLFEEIQRRMRQYWSPQGRSNVVFSPRYDETGVIIAVCRDILQKVKSVRAPWWEEIFPCRSYQFVTWFVCDWSCYGPCGEAFGKLYANRGYGTDWMRKKIIYQNPPMCLGVRWQESRVIARTRSLKSHVC